MATHCKNTSPQNAFYMLRIFKSYKTVDSASFYKRNMLYNQSQSDLFLLFPKLYEKFVTALKKRYSLPSLWLHTIGKLPPKFAFQMLRISK